MIVDCFPFFNELDLLEIRLHELDPVVDRFVIVEGMLTFSNRPKDLVFPYHRSRFAPFLPKIDYLVMSNYSDVNTADAWAIEHAQKQVGLDHALELTAPGDLLIYGDCDEIPRASAIRRAKEMDFRQLVLEMDLFYYFFNCRCSNKIWKMPRLVRLGGERLKHRQIRRRRGDASLKDAGWHFSYMGDIKLKLDSFAHLEYAKPPYNTPEHIERAVSGREDLFGRGLRFELCHDPTMLPQHVQDNLDRFGGYLCR